MLGVLIAADLIVVGVFGKPYVDSVPVLRVLFLTAPSLFAVVVGTFMANALHLERAAVKFLLASLALNVALNSFCIPLWGELGAAWTTFVSETLLAGLLVRLILGKLQEWEAGAVRPKPAVEWSPSTDVEEAWAQHDEAL